MRIECKEAILAPREDRAGMPQERAMTPCTRLQAGFLSAREPCLPHKRSLIDCTSSKSHFRNAYR